MAWLDCVVDVSHHNGPIVWSGVDPGIVLVFAKASQGASFRDGLFPSHRETVPATGRLLIPYHFIDASDTDAQIANFKPCVGAGQPFMLDWEGRQSATQIPLEVEHMGTRLVAVTGGQPVGYWGIAGSTPGDPTATMKTWTQVRPHYPRLLAEIFLDLSSEDVIRAGPETAFWQYTETGKVAGITGSVDRSVWNGTAAELRAWYTGQMAPPAALLSPSIPAPRLLRYAVPPMYGKDVDYIKAQLNLWGIDPPVSGPDFNADCVDAVRVFQDSNGLVVDGIVGPQTWAKLSLVQPKKE